MGATLAAMGMFLGMQGAAAAVTVMFQSYFHNVQLSGLVSMFSMLPIIYLDGHDGNGSYDRGSYWYAKTFPTPRQPLGVGRVYVKILAAGQQAAVYVLPEVSERAEGVANWFTAVGDQLYPFPGQWYVGHDEENEPLFHGRFGGQYDAQGLFEEH